MGRIIRSLLRGRLQDTVELILHRYLFLRMRPWVKEYVSYVERLEEGLYDKGTLDVDALRRKEIPKLPCFRESPAGEEAIAVSR